MAKILVIEDEESIRENILELLEAENFEGIGAINGQAGIKLAIAQIPDLILCDMMMPEVDGHGVLKALRSEPLTATIPFIFLTAKADKSDIRTGMELGADDYITKPCTPQELLKAIAIRLEKQKTISKQSQKKLDELRTNISMSIPHELRTPLNAILGFSELILSEYHVLEEPDILDMIGQINTSGHRLYRLIQNFLLYAELEMAATNPELLLEMRNSEFSCVKSLLSEKARQQAKQVNRTDDLQLNLQDASVAIDSMRLTKIVEELLDNAFKFSLEGTPILFSTFVENQTFILSVKDQGRGMTPAQIAQLEAYRQFDRKLYQQPGLGLGLAIVQRLAELHGGQFKIESLPQQETIVSVSLPI
ncbi:MAG: response regulator [Microcoleus sp. PH2017_10_PVI_O_A]|uniref:hybrid sensor histidine kinase/response regulator n=1 Tax=unclassified Microcoleus TaxID=2642155 RepID=UPI001D482BD7|nr:MULTISPECIES: response regulator [unclassified Microcoleus]TAE79346.1 MAG: hybrid sensor histidine kinase/response regulator [Oscillatoriales cyanobacterium]MCC3408401.1 response regulator [Microcoleus sp. PH2017_10_PVI_O_A]MCC3462462.1 response regulator [Microcoleus sp. PH2017_11_PCY_U_A]MCC3480927.1 response regulator [Microcoleus sp. PH2017_12_PCY_D_A]MCC3531021.1 response regulator [Microcoleus sp. PH2017_21_RUC_O_A]